MLTSLALWAAMVFAVAAALCWALPRYRDWIVVGASIAFIARQDWQSLVMVSVLTGAAWLVTQKLATPSKWPGRLVILAALALLATFKYAPPIVEAITGAKHVEESTRRALAGPAAGVATVGIPLGISYFTFKLIHYVVDASRKQIPKHRPETFFGYMLFFPMFAAGPIERFDAYLKNRTPRVTRQQFIDGGTRIAYGLIKKLVIVNILLDRKSAHEVDKLYEAVPFIFSPLPVELLVRDIATVHPLFVWQFVVHQFTTWYLDFSAYSDIAIGAGLILGVKLGENFDWPLFAPNPTEFWKRYHISLSAWCQRYVYLPVMGQTRNPYLAVYATMGTMGLWHAGSLNYLGWGLYHATVLSIYLTWGRIKRAKKWKPKGPAILVAGTVATALAVCASAVFPATSAFGLKTALSLFAVLFGLRF